MGWIPARDEALSWLFVIPAAFLCRIFYLMGQPRQAVESERRSAASGTQNA
jgi:hypothetical protein